MVTKLIVPPPRRILAGAGSLQLRWCDVRPRPLQHTNGSEAAQSTNGSEAPQPSDGAEAGWSQRRVMRTVGGSLLAIVVVVVAAWAWLDVRDATARTSASLRDTRREVDEARDDLATASDELEAAQATLADELDTLGLRQEERAAAQAALDASGVALNERRGRLDASTSELQVASTHLDALRRCVVGVSGALNQSAVADTRGAAATVRRMADTCAQAGVAL